MIEQLTHHPGLNKQELAAIRRSLKNNRADTAITHLKRLAENSEGLSEVDNFRLSHVRAEVLCADGSLNSLANAEAECINSVRRISVLPKELVTFYEAAFFCTWAEIQRVKNKGVNADITQILPNLIKQIDENHPAHNVLTHYANRTLALDAFPHEDKMETFLDTAKIAYFKNKDLVQAGTPDAIEIPHDGIMELDSLGQLNISVINSFNHHPLSSYYELPTA